MENFKDSYQKKARRGEYKHWHYEHCLISKPQMAKLENLRALNLSPSRKTSNKDFIEKIDIEEVLSKVYKKPSPKSGFIRKIRLCPKKNLKSIVETNLFLKSIYPNDAFSDLSANQSDSALKQTPNNLSLRIPIRN